MALRNSLGRSLVVAGILTAVAVPVAGGVAYAATSAQQNPQLTASTHHKPTELSTRMANVHIRSAAKLGKLSKVVATLRMSGSKLTVSCYKTGANVGGDTTWYRTVSPRTGYIAGHELAVTKEPAMSVTACKTKK